MDRLKLIQRNLAFFYRGDPSYAGEGFRAEKERVSPSDTGSCSGSDASSYYYSGSASSSSVDSNARWDFVNVLLVGSGGIGCEILHLLALSGFSDNITVIDMDTIELSNLNRQFLFREEDIGKPKSHVAAAYINERFGGFHVQSIFGRVEEQSDDFYRQFDLVLLALDSIPARLWVNKKMAQLAEWKVVAYEEDDHQQSFSSGAGDAATPAARPSRNYMYRIVSATPLIDTGTEGYKGHCNVVLMADGDDDDQSADSSSTYDSDGNSNDQSTRAIQRTTHVSEKTCCLQCCGLANFNTTVGSGNAANSSVPMCTLENIPRSPEHCVLYVRYKMWADEQQRKRMAQQSREDEANREEVGEEEPDLDNEEHLQWIAQKSEERRRQFGIELPSSTIINNAADGIDTFFVLGVLKNVTPAVSFVNGLIAALAVQETLKLLTGIAGRKNFIPCVSDGRTDNERAMQRSNDVLMTHNLCNYNGNTLDSSEGFFCNTMRVGYDASYMNCPVCGPRPVLCFPKQHDSTADAPPLSISDIRRLIMAKQPTDLADGIARDPISFRFYAERESEARDEGDSRSSESGSSGQSAGRSFHTVEAESDATSLQSLFKSHGHGTFLEKWRACSSVVVFVFFSGAREEGTRWMPAIWV